MTQIKLFAGTDVGLRDNNEDNFTVNPDLTLDVWMVPASQQETIQLGKRGCLMVVADGMGGMNAGEVASDIAIKTVQEMFSPTKMPANIVDRHESIKEYLRKTIVEADRQVKKHCKKDPSTEGMGSTIVIAWLIHGLVYVGWLGDSRAYSYKPGKGIQRLSKDHSYVQELVDAKTITEEEAMLHPQSNVIMRSLGDVTQKAKPGIICHPVAKGEIILLCSDGLCGVCADNSIAEIVGQTSSDLRNCKESLTNAALEADGSDNITIALLEIVETDEKSEGADDSQPLFPGFFSWQNILFVAFAFGIVSALIFAGLRLCNNPISEETVKENTVLKKDTVSKKEVIKDEEKKEEKTTVIKSLVNTLSNDTTNKTNTNNSTNDKDSKDSLEMTDGSSGAPVEN